jgi:hypothetical protein
MGLGQEGALQNCDIIQLGSTQLQFIGR